MPDILIPALMMLAAAATGQDAAQTCFQARAVRATAGVSIDGEVADAEWAGAPVFTDLIQFEPRRGDPSLFRTEARLLCDSAFVYVAFKGWDPEG